VRESSKMGFSLNKKKTSDGNIKKGNGNQKQNKSERNISETGHEF
jgi:hypothetical protein